MATLPHGLHGVAALAAAAIMLRTGSARASSHERASRVRSNAARTPWPGTHGWSTSFVGKCVGCVWGGKGQYVPSSVIW